MNIKIKWLAFGAILFCSLSVAVAIFTVRCLQDTTYHLLPYSATDTNEQATWHSDLITLHNTYRTENNLEIFHENDRLNKLAKDKAYHMMSNCYWDHYFDDQVVSFQWARVEDETGKRYYNYTYIGENLGKNFISLNVMFEAWTLSTDHNENILNEHYSEIGLYTYPRKYKCKSAEGELIDFTNVTTVIFGTEAL